MAFVGTLRTCGAPVPLTWVLGSHQAAANTRHKELHLIRAYSILFLAIPFGSVALATIISMIIPGCKLDEGAGASGCGSLGPILSTGVWLGFPVLICGLMGLVPIGIFVAVKNLLTGKAPDENQPQNTCEKVALDAVLQYKNTGSIQAKCPRCSTRIKLITDSVNKSTVNLQCGCGGCDGKYMLHARQANAQRPNS